MIALRMQRVASEETRKMILTAISNGDITADDLLHNKYLNHALFENYF
jgi:hypothetical protein